MKHSLLWPTLILLLAAWFRLWHFESSPPGLQHDELFKAQEGRAIVEANDWRWFYPSNQGHEGAYVWLNGLSYALFGPTRVMVKMPALSCGLLTLALIYQMGGRLFNRRVALLAMSLGAVGFWLVFTNRVGLRANLLPLVSLVVLYGLWRVGFGLPFRNRYQRGGIAILTGFGLGLAIYTYTASIALYLAYGGFLGALLLFRRDLLFQRRYEWLLITLLGAGLTLPMIQTRLNDPQGQNRANTINIPYTELRAGNPDPMLNNARQLLLMPFYTGDPEWRYNIAGRPLFWPPVGLLVYIGIGRLLWRIHQPINALLLGMIFFGLIPSLLTLAAPSYLRSILLAPILLWMVGWGLDGVLTKLKSPQWYSAIAILLVVVTAWRDGRAYFIEWTNRPEVPAIYRDDLEQLAASLRGQEQAVIYATTGEPTLLDPAIYEFSNPAPQTEIVWLNGQTVMILSQQPALLYVSPFSPISPAHQAWLGPAYGTQQRALLYRQDGQIAFEVYQLGLPSPLRQQSLEQAAQFRIYIPPEPPFPSDQLLDWAQPGQLPVTFGDVLQLVGVEMPSNQIPPQDNGVDTGLQLQLYLRTLQSHVPESLSLFVQFIAWDGSAFAGRDFLGLPPLHWQADVTFVQDHYVGDFALEPRPYFVSLGLYNTLTGQRYPIRDSAGQVLGDDILLGQLTLVKP
jgi:4-amino-4-deoxy-L-arabinose transferase-like glycosyltransferase